MRPTLRGVLLLLIAAPLMAAGTWTPALEWVAWLYGVVCLALFALDWRYAGPVTQFDLTREHDTRLSIGVDNPIRLRLHNRSRRAITFWVRDEPPDVFEISARVLTGDVAALGKWENGYTLQPLRRGDYRFGNLNLRWLSPLKFLTRQAIVPAVTDIKVYPNLMDVRRYDLLLRRNRLQEIGLRPTRMFGEGVDFERLREYLPDDDFRRIDWKATARRHRPVTIEYQTERSQTVVTVLDVGRMMQSPVNRMAKLDYVINSVLLLSYVITGKGDKAGLMTFADDVLRFMPPEPGRGQFYRMLETLYAVEAQPVEPNYHRALSYLAIKQRKRALVIIFTDLSSGPGLKALIRHTAILRRRSLPLVVTISDPDVYAAAHQIPHNSLSVYQRSTAGRLLDERQVALHEMQRQGVLTLDVPANQLSVAVINLYLEIKARTML